MKNIDTPPNTKLFPYGSLGTSYSSIDMFMQCPKKWYKAIFMGEAKFEESDQLIFGKIAHYIIELFIKSGFSYSMGQMIDIYEEQLQSKKIKYSSEEYKTEALQKIANMIDYLLSEKEYPESEKSSFGKIFFHGASELEIPFKLKYKLPQPIKINNKLYEYISINGTIDQKVEYKDDLYIIDHKTGKVFSDEKLREHFQMHIYSMACMRKYNKMPIKGFFNFITANEYKPIYLSMNEIKRAVAQINYTLNDMFLSINYKANPSPLCYWCQFGKHHESTCNNSSNWEPQNKN